MERNVTFAGATIPSRDGHQNGERDLLSMHHNIHNHVHPAEKQQYEQERTQQNVPLLQRTEPTLSRQFEDRQQHHHLQEREQLKQHQQRQREKESQNEHHLRLQQIQEAALKQLGGMSGQYETVKPALNNQRPHEEVPVPSPSAIAKAIADLVVQKVSSFSGGGHTIDIATVAKVALQEYLKIQAQRNATPPTSGDELPCVPNYIPQDSQTLEAEAQVLSPYATEAISNNQPRSIETSAANVTPNTALYSKIAHLPLSHASTVGGINTDNAGSTSHYRTDTAYSNGMASIDFSRTAARSISLCIPPKGLTRPLQKVAPRILPYGPMAQSGMPQQFQSTSEFLNSNRHLAQSWHPQMNLEPSHPSTNIGEHSENFGGISVQGNSAKYAPPQRTNTPQTSIAHQSSAPQAKFPFALPDMKRTKPKMALPFLQGNQCKPFSHADDFLEVVISAILEHHRPETVTYYDICDVVNLQHGKMLDGIQPDWRERIRELLATSPAFLRREVSKFVYWSVAPHVFKKAAELWQANHPRAFFQYTPQLEMSSGSALLKQQTKQKSSRTVQLSSPKASLAQLAETPNRKDEEESAKKKQRGRPPKYVTPEGEAKQSENLPKDAQNHNENGMNSSSTLTSSKSALSLETNASHNGLQLNIENGQAVVSGRIAKLTTLPSSEMGSTVSDAKATSIDEQISSSSSPSRTSPIIDMSSSLPKPCITSDVQQSCIDLTDAPSPDPQPPKAALARNPELYSFGNAQPAAVSKKPVASKPASKKKPVGHREKEAGKGAHETTIDPLEYQNLLLDHARLQMLLKETNERNSELTSELHRTRTEFETREKRHCSEIAERDLKLCLVSDAISDLVNQFPADILKAMSGECLKRAKRGEVLEGQKLDMAESGSALWEKSTNEEEAGSNVGSGMSLKRKWSPEVSTKE